MSSEKSYFRLGLFVVVGIALIVAGVIVFGAGIFFQPKFDVETSVTESIQGLDIGADVRYQGVQMGRLKHVQLGASLSNEDDTKMRQALAKQVILTMEIFDDRMPDRKGMSRRQQIEDAVASGMRVRMAKGGLTGPNYLELIILDPAKYPSVPPAYKPANTYIPSTPSFSVTVTSGIEALAEEFKRMRLADTVDNANKLLIDMQQILGNLQTKTVGDRLVATLDQAHASATRIREILDGPEVKTMLDGAAGAATGAKKLTNSEDLNKFVAQLPVISEQLRATIDHIDTVVSDPAIGKTLQGTANIGPAVADIRRVLRELNGILASRRNQIDSLIVNLQRASDNAAKMTEDAAANPARVLFGEPPTRNPSK